MLCWGTSTGFAMSPEARKVAEFIQSRRSAFFEATSLGSNCEKAIADLMAISEECQDANWDGQGAAPVLPQTVDLARRFIEALPLGAATFSVGVEPDGHLTFEWYRSPRNLLSVSVSPSGNVHFAATLGSRKRYGSEPFIDEVSKEILNLISEVGIPSDELPAAA
jgi:hypothetical protein